MGGDHQKVYELTKGALRSEKSRAKNAFQHGVVVASTLRRDADSAAGDNLSRAIGWGNTTVLVFRHLFGLGFAAFLFYLSYNLHTSKRNVRVESEKNKNSLDPCK